MNKALYTLIVTLTAITLLTGCGGQKTYEDPLTTMMDRSEGADDRMAAAAQLKEEAPDSAQRITALKTLVVSREHPWEMGFYAMDELMELDREATLDWLSKDISRIENNEVYERVALLAIEEERKNFIPAIARRMRVQIFGTPDEERQELKDLEALSGTDWASAMKQVVEGQYGAKDMIVTRSDVWEALVRLKDEDTLKTWAKSSTTDLAPLRVVRETYKDFGFLPKHRMTLLRLQLAQLDGEAGQYARVKAFYKRLPDENKIDFAARHFPVINYAYEYRPALLQMDRDRMLARIRDEMKTKISFERQGRDARAQHLPQSEKFEDQIDLLSNMDLISILIFLDMMRDPAVITNFYNQAEVDMEDTQTEHGGLLAWNNGGLYSTIPYPPEEIAHDRAYIAPKKLMLDAFDGLAIYHFHAQKYKNFKLAGPGSSDIDFAENSSVNNLVLTFIDKDRLNVDYFNDAGVIIDLGIIRRP